MANEKMVNEKWKILIDDWLKSKEAKGNSFCLSSVYHALAVTPEQGCLP
jgi:hypothetical protein